MEETWRHASGGLRKTQEKGVLALLIEKPPAPLDRSTHSGRLTGID